jgi:hypothetical protein
MRAVVDGIEIEGTPAEVAEFVRSLKGRTEATDVSLGKEQSFTEEIESSEINEKFAYRVLKRRPLSANQVQLLSFLNEAQGNWVLASELKEKFGWDGPTLGGILGGLGRRLTATKGYKNGYHLWHWQWNEDEGEWEYMLPGAMIAALIKLDL